MSRGPMLVAGIGTYANSIVAYELADHTRFKATVGLSTKPVRQQHTDGTVQFLIFTKSPLRPAPADLLQVPVALAELGLPAGSTVQDLWYGRVLGPLSGSFVPYIRRYGTGFY